MGDSNLAIRMAHAGDLEAINGIYNYYVLGSTCTYQVEPETMMDRRAWFEHHGEMHPVIVAEVAGRVVGWGSLSAYHKRAAYARTIENSVYVHHDFHKRGIGSAILAELIRLARDRGHHTIVAAIDGDQAASVALHARLGFKHIGRMMELGNKFDRWLDVIYMQLML